MKHFGNAAIFTFVALRERGVALWMRQFFSTPKLPRGLDGSLFRLTVRHISCSCEVCPLQAILEPNYAHSSSFRLPMVPLLLSLSIHSAARQDPTGPTMQCEVTLIRHRPNGHHHFRQLNGFGFSVSRYRRQLRQNLYRMNLVKLIFVDTF